VTHRPAQTGLGALALSSTSLSAGPGVMDTSVEHP
jgi:hypothetical protein